MDSKLDFLLEYVLVLNLDLKSGQWLEILLGTMLVCRQVGF